MPNGLNPAPRASVDGKFFRRGVAKFPVRGIAYGPFAPDAAGRCFASPEQTRADFLQIRAAGANVVRVYTPPERWFLDLAAEHDLLVFAGIPWDQQVCFLDTPGHRAAALRAVANAVMPIAGHPALFAWAVANEIQPDIVRWSGARAVTEFLEALIGAAKQADPGALCTFTNYPPTEFLCPAGADFLCFNVYLHEPGPFRQYLDRLQMAAEGRPLVLGEFGMDSIREGEARKSAFLEWQVETLFRAGLAGGVVFSFTDDWWHGGKQVEGWEMGITTRDRRPKESYTAVRKAFTAAPRFPLPRVPRISVVVAAYNAARTLKTCLDSLGRIDYPDYEVILVDDGSEDATGGIASQYRWLHYLRHEQNLGLSAARNTGIAAASGEIIAFTDADCRADEDWLYYLAGDLLAGGDAGVGGPNLLPPDDSVVAAAVMASPGGPAHVMLTDRLAEHIPGCNMAFYKQALLDIGGFDARFRQAGDDVDVCWRLQRAGRKIRFSPGGFVWHYRRSRIIDYFRQQYGYGQAEADLVRKHPEYFNAFGGGIWRGRIYASAPPAGLPRRTIIYRGIFGSGGFQTPGAPAPSGSLVLCTTLEYHVLVTLPLAVFAGAFPDLLPLPLASLALPLILCATAAAQASLPREKTRWWSRPLIAALFFLQPIVRGWARHRHQLRPQREAGPRQAGHPARRGRESGHAPGEVCYWSADAIDRVAFLRDLLAELDRRGWPNRADSGWEEWDVEIYDTRWSRLHIVTVTEEERDGCRLRCRLRPRWSLKAKLAFWALCGIELLCLGALPDNQIVRWIPAVAAPLLAWLLSLEQRALQRRIAAVLDDVARARRLTRVPPPGAQKRP